jgi:hypothetical protein
MGMVIWNVLEEDISQIWPISEIGSNLYMKYI